MSDGATPVSSRCSDEAWLRREEVLLRFENEWRAGCNPRIEDFLGEPGDAELLVELVYLDIEYRRKHSQPATYAEYQARFPQLPSEQQESAADASSPPVVAGYQVLSEIGRGGMGVVYRAQQTAVGRLVALKVLRILDGPSVGGMSRLRIEAEAIGRLQHPNIVQIYDVGETNGRPYLAMELVDGKNLGDRLKTGALAPRDAAQLVATLAQAIHHAHTRGIVHRDLTPGNILLDNSDHQLTVPKITDFGLAKVLEGDHSEQTQTGAILGTPSYMAPEQARGHVRLVGPCTDVYGLGAVLFATLTGRPPFRGPSTWETTRQVIEDLPPSLSKLAVGVPHDLETICRKCLAKAPHQRYSSAQHLADDLNRFLQRQPITARRVGAAERLRLWARRNPAVAATTAIAILCVLLTGAIGFGQVLVERDRFRRQRDRAEANLFQSLLTDARAQIKARDSGWWWSAMDSLRRAAALKVPDRDTAGLRDVVVECMGSEYPCFRLHGGWKGHQGFVTAVALSADGRIAASGSADQIVRVWSIPDGKCLATCAGHTGTITGVAIHPNDSQMVSSSLDGTLRWWPLNELHSAQTQSISSVRTVHLDAGSVNAIAFAPDGAFLTAGCQDGSVFLVPGMGSELPRRLSREDGEVLALTFQPGKPTLAISVADQPVRFRELESGQEQHRQHLGDHIRSLAFDPTGAHMAAADPASFGFCVIPVPPKGSVLGYHHLHTNSVVHLSRVARIGRDRFNDWMTAALDGSIRLWETDYRGLNERAVARGDFGPVRSAAVGGDKPWVVAGYGDGQLRIWELAVPAQRNIPVGGAAPTTTFIGRTRKLVHPPVICDYSTESDPTAVLIPEPGFGHGMIWSVAASNNGRWFVTGWNDGSLRVRNADSLQLMQTLTGHGDQVWSAAFSPNSKYLASGGNDIRIWHTADWKQKWALDVGNHLVRAVAFHPHQPWLVAAVKDRTIRAWNYETGQPLGPPVQLDTEAFGLAFRPDGKRLAAACFDQLVRVWDLPNDAANPWPAKPATWQIDGHHAEVWAAAYSPDGRWLATGSERGIILMDAASHQRLVTLRGAEGQVRSLSFSADGELLAAATYYKATIVWRLPLVRQALSELGLDW